LKEVWVREQEGKEKGTGRGIGGQKRLEVVHTLSIEGGMGEGTGGEGEGNRDEAGMYEERRGRRREQEEELEGRRGWTLFPTTLCTHSPLKE
jgi:hypothetical protein